MLSPFPPPNVMTIGKSSRLSSAILHPAPEDNSRSRPSSHTVFPSQVAHAHVPQRVRSMDFTADGKCLVTCGDRLVKFWTMPDSFLVLRDTGGTGSEEIGVNGVDGKAGKGRAKQWFVWKRTKRSRARQTHDGHGWREPVTVGDTGFVLSAATAKRMLSSVL